MVCPDYDLCSVCETKGGHAHHNMIRIRNPAGAGPPPFPWFMPWMSGRPMGRGGCGGRRGPNRRGPCYPGFRRARGGFPRGAGPFGYPPPGAPEAAAEEQEMSGEEANSNESGGAFFHQFGHALHSFLGPFGVDVHTYVDNDQGDPGIIITCILLLCFCLNFKFNLDLVIKI